MASISALGFFPNLTNFARGSPRLLPPEGRDFKRGAPQISRISALERDGLFESEAFSLGGETRRKLLLLSTIGFAIGTLQHALDNGKAGASEFADMPALRGKDYGKTKMRYPDYTETQSGLQYKDLRVGDGPTPKMGDMVVGDDKGFFKFKLGLGQVIPAFEEAVVGMAPGGIRRIIVPPELGYPDNDFNKLGPRPTTFSGQRALDFVLRNQGLIDKTLLFDIELLKIIPN
ncbi:peptidyl-prolyl cis-trans isomerase FKBP19, chloroplastic isoform X2 [Phoenix dactylifera]|uniref:peptidylprolyl isomerase n=1 Tax=Phoenix dactylifera TaxID=42345 RepID=A0A8B7CDS2_PHODC|nr:peptidyl-prolyl cis-trans isomerase FKBP19, chloroplastic isoform X2 [Phoenix dactylifera]